MREPPGVEVVEGLAGAGRVTVLVGESGTGKSFVTDAILAAQADGQAFCGRSTTWGSVAKVAFEQDALGERLRALKDQGFSLEDFHVLRAEEPISPRVSSDGIEQPSRGELFLTRRLQALVHDLAARGRPPLVHVVIDTVRASMAGAEESSETVSAYLRAASRRGRCRTSRGPDALVHHAGARPGRTASRRSAASAGSSAFRGNVDFTHYLEADDTGDEEDASEVRLVLRTLKSRDGERRAPLRLIRRRVDLGSLDQYGNARTSCVIVPDPRSRGRTGRPRPRRFRRRRELADDLLLLELMATRPDATSGEDLRALAGLGKPRAAAAVSRLVARGCARRGTRGKPYTVLPEGQRALENERDRTGPEQDRGPARSARDRYGTWELPL